MLGIRVSRRSYVFARFTALLHALFRTGVSLLLPRAVLAGQVPPEPQAAETFDEAVTSVELDSSTGFLDEGGFLALVVEAGPVAWFVLATLLFFSLVSWAIILHKSRRLGQLERSSAAFLNHFRSAKRFADVVAWARKHPDSPLARLFHAGYQEVRYQSRQDQEDEEPVRLRVSNMEAVARSLLRASSTETAALEHRMMFLATTGGATPFIGLFGTVWGIMNSFRDIALTQSANISVVAPGVSEALIATAAGLGAAIPAVIAYNAFLAQIRRITTTMDDFSMEYVAMLERHLAR
ncbi:MAG: MotA/TolQ/ExbB proton channel family protein [Acidobacteriota bacterium]|nr:MotA/TolQ/ExbB proton channel family protein [Acidobacteriota bacterium]